MSDRDKKTGLFLKGKIGGPGRPKGSRNKLGEVFLNAMAEDFEQHGVAVIEAVRTEKPDVYLKVVASILPKESNINSNPLQDWSDEELESALDLLRHAVADSGNPGTGTAH